MRCSDLAMEAARKGKKLDKWIGRESVLAIVLAPTLRGETLFSLCICLSPAERNGGESWCSLKFGQTCSNLRVRVEAARPEQVDGLINSTKKVTSHRLKNTLTNNFVSESGGGAGCPGQAGLHPPGAGQQDVPQEGGEGGPAGVRCAVPGEPRHCGQRHEDMSTTPCTFNI